MSASWGGKFEKKLQSLADGASKESIQTLATWMIFNRKYASAFSQVLLQKMTTTGIESSAATATTPTNARQPLYWQLIHQIMLCNKEDQGKWDRALDMRVTIGESVILVALPELIGKTQDTESSTVTTTADSVEAMIKEWDQHNVFGGPTLIGQFKRILVSARSKTTDPVAVTESSNTPSTTTTTTNTTTTTAVAEEVSAVMTPTTTATDSPKKSVSTAKETAKEPIAVEVIHNSSVGPALVSQPPPIDRRVSMSSVGSSASTSGKQRRTSVSSIQSSDHPSTVDYDFENSNIPFGIVESKEFLDPCKAVAILQITRDILHDTPVQLHGLLSNLPKDIKEYVTALSEQNEKQQGDTTVPSVEELDEGAIRDYSIRIPRELLEKELLDQIQTIQTFQDIVRRQQQARQRLIYLLIRSRCQLGSNEAARLYHQLDTTMAALNKKKQALVDALELEGMDSVVLEDKSHEKQLEAALADLTPLTWYNHDGEDETGSSSKRQKVD